MGEKARVESGHVLVRDLIALACWHCFGLSESKGGHRAGAFEACACRKIAYKYLHAVKCRNRLRVGVRVENAACWGLRVGPPRLSEHECLWGVQGQDCRVVPG